jgi:uncharacterized protein with von Willebrand factor type A (vWA) domain
MTHEQKKIIAEADQIIAQAMKKMGEQLEKREQLEKQRKHEQLLRKLDPHAGPAPF